MRSRCENFRACGTEASEASGPLRSTSAGSDDGLPSTIFDAHIVLGKGQYQPWRNESRERSVLCIGSNDGGKRKTVYVYETMRDEHERQIHASPWTDNPLASQMQRILCISMNTTTYMPTLVLLFIVYCAQFRPQSGRCRGRQVLYT